MNQLACPRTKTKTAVLFSHCDTSRRYSRNFFHQVSLRAFCTILDFSEGEKQKRGFVCLTMTHSGSAQGNSFITSRQRLMLAEQKVSGGIDFG